MTARVHADNLIERAREIRRLSEHQSREIIRDALLDITLDIALTVANKAAELCEQQEMYPQKKLRIMRDTRALWKAVAKNVRATYDDHPINDRQLYVVLMAYHPKLIHNYEKLFDIYLEPDDCQLLHYTRPATRPAAARSVVLQVLARY